MKQTQIKLSASCETLLLTLASSLRENYMVEALKHKETLVKAADGKTIAEHAEAAKTHAKAADDHLDSGIKGLYNAIGHGK